MSLPMPLEGTGKFYRFSKSRSVIQVSQVVAADSQWPFEEKEALTVRIDPENERVIIERRPNGTRRRP